MLRRGEVDLTGHPSESIVISIVNTWTNDINNLNQTVQSERCGILDVRGNYQHYNPPWLTFDEEQIISMLSITVPLTQKLSTDFEEDVQSQTAQDKDYQEIVRVVLASDVEKEIASNTVVGELILWTKGVTIPDQEDQKISIFENEPDSGVARHIEII